MEGIKNFRDKKMSSNIVKDFVKDEEERKKLGKVKTYYEMESIKKSLEVCFKGSFQIYISRY